MTYYCNYYFNSKFKCKKDEDMTESSTDLPKDKENVREDEADSSMSESEQAAGTSSNGTSEPVQINLYQLVLEMAREDKFFLTIFLIVILVLVLLLQLASVFLYCTLF